jgi:hypothetical protein
MIAPEQFERELWVLSKGHMRSARKYHRDAVRIFRTRVWASSERPKGLRELSYPPKHVTPLNRANLDGDPVFYASAGLPASFVECRLSAGEHVVCSEWRNTMDMTLQGVGLSKDENALSALSNIERIYHEMFTSPDPAMYKFSARVARHLLASDQISGLLYGSVAAQNESQNVALKTAFVDAGLRFINASLYHIKGTPGPYKYVTEEIDFAVPNADDSLDWKGRRRQWMIRKPGDQLEMVSNGWCWDAYDLDGRLFDPE